MPNHFKDGIKMKPKLSLLLAGLIFFCLFGSAIGNTFQPVLSPPAYQYNGIEYLALPEPTVYNINLSGLTKKFQHKIVVTFIFYTKILISIIMTSFIAILLKMKIRQPWSVKNYMSKKWPNKNRKTIQETTSITGVEMMIDESR